MRQLEAWLRRHQYSFIRVLIALQLIYFFLFCFVHLDFILHATGKGFLLAAVVAAGLICGCLLLVGRYRSAVPALLAFSLIATIESVPAFREVQFPYLSMILIVYALFTPEKKQRAEQPWRVPLFLSVYLGFTASGIAKATLPLWTSGDALGRLCEIGFVLDPLDVFCREPFSIFGARFVLIAELLSFPLAVTPRTRPIAWTLNSLIHSAALFLLPLRPVSAGVLTMQLFLFDSAWLKHLTLVGYKHPAAPRIN